MPKITRRRFLQASAASAGAIALTKQMGDSLQAMELTEHGASVNRTTSNLRKAIPSVCQMCTSKCGILGFVDNGKLVKIQGNPKDPNSRGRLCAKGQAGVNILYSPDRLKSPLKRTGTRGAGKWEEISWDEALNQIADKMRELREKQKTSEFIFQDGLQEAKGYTARFLNAYGPATVFSYPISSTSNKRTAHELTWGAPFNVPSATAAHYILNFGSNPFESHMLFNSFTQRIVDARMRGARLITFDPRLSNTAGRSDEWVPIKPGTDGIVALAMANIIMREGLADRQFLDKWTNLPSEQLAAHLSKYTPEDAEKESGVSAADIRRIALEFAKEKPAVAISGGGISAHQNGTYNERAIALLNAITGNIDIEGGACLPRVISFGDADPKPAIPTFPGANIFPAIAGQTNVVRAASLNPAINDKKLPVSVLLTHQYNPAFSDPNTDFTSDVLKNTSLIPFFVAIDSFMSETAFLADIVLPCATYLESWGLESPPALEMVPFISYQQPIVPPRAGSKTFAEICTELAKRIGGGMEQYFAFSSMDGYLSSVIANNEGLQKDGGLAYLKENGVWYDRNARPNFRSYETQGFATPSKKYEILSEELQKQGFSALPVYQQIKGHDKIGDGEFYLTTFRYNVHSDSRTAAAMWLSEITHENGAWINFEVAHSLGIKKGDEIKISSPVGNITAKALPTHGIHPKSIAIGENVGHWEFGKVAQAIRFQSEEPNTRLIWWGGDGKGVHPFRIIPASTDSVGGGQGWMDTVVTISKSGSGSAKSSH